VKNPAKYSVDPDLELEVLKKAARVDAEKIEYADMCLSELADDADRSCAEMNDDRSIDLKAWVPKTCGERQEALSDIAATEYE
jgi:hypothetical protein